MRKEAGGGGGKWAAVERRQWCERPGREWWSRGLGIGFRAQLKTWRFVGGHKRTVVSRREISGD